MAQLAMAFTPQFFQGMRVTKQTRKNYNKATKELKEWVAGNHADLMEDAGGEIDVAAFTANPDIFQEWLLTHKDKRGALKLRHSLTPLRSAWNDYVLKRNKGGEVAKGFNQSLTAFFTGMAKHETQKKADGTLTSKEGKDELPHEVLKAIAPRAIKQLAFKAGIFFFAFLLLSWSLVSRTSNVSHLCFRHLELRGDAIGIRFHRTKTNQKGDIERFKHIFANPFSPSTCPVLALGTYFLCNPCIEGNYLFPGDNTSGSFCKQLKQLCTDVAGVALFTLLGLSDVDIGTHSIRKGAGTYAMGGSPAGPNVISLCKRAGWSIGDVKERYLKMIGQGQDCLLGRVLAMLDIMSEEFAVLPPHFLIDIAAGAGDALRTKVLGAVETCFPGVSKKSPNMTGVLQRCLASVVFHAKKPAGGGPSSLEKLFPADHPLWNTPLFTEGLFDELAPHVACGTFKCDVTGMVASGLPPHCTLMVRICKIERQLETLLGAGQESLRAQLKADLSEMMEQFCAQQGNISADSLKQIVAAAVGGLEGRMLALLQPVLPESPPAEEEEPAAALGPRDYKWYNHNGQMITSWLPEDHKLPKGCTLKVGWNLYIRGKPAERQAAYKYCSGKDFRLIAAKDNETDAEKRARMAALTQRRRFSKWVKVYEAMIQLIKGKPYYKNKPTPQESQKMYEEALVLIEPLMPDQPAADSEQRQYKRRFQQLSPDTLYNDFCKKKKQKKVAEAAAAAALLQAQ